MNQKIKILFSNFLLAAILSSIGVSNAFAQQNSIFQQVSRAPKDYSNLTPPTQYIDSFLGQDKKGPYVLTWKNFNFGPGSPVWVSVDNQILPTASYELDIVKGEILFNALIKRTQVIKITYGYYTELASKNVNPTMVAPLTLKIASLGINNLNITTFNNNASQDPNFVLGLNSKRSGFSSNILFAPGQSNINDQSSIKVGYNTGNIKNGINIDYSRNGKNFSSIYGKTFGINDSLQTLNLGGNLTAASSSLTFNRKDTRNLQNNQGGLNQTAFLKVGGNRNQPLITFSSSEQEGLDAKGVFNSSNINNGLFNQKFGALDLAYKTSKSDITSGKNNTIIDQNSLNLALLPDPKKNQPGFSFNRSNDIVETGSLITSTISDKSSISSNFAGGNISFNSLQKNISLPSKSVQQVDQRSIDVGFKGNTKGFSGLSFGRVEDDKVDNNHTSTINNKANFGGVYSNTKLNVSFNKIDTTFNGKSRVDQDQENILFSLRQTKMLPEAKFTRNDDLKRDPKGVLVGAANDMIDIKTNLLGSNFTYKSLKSETYSADGKFTTIDSNVTNLSIKAGLGLFNTELTQNNTFVNNKASSIDQFRYSYSLPANKSMSGFKLQRSDYSQNVAGLQSENAANELIYGAKFGPMVLTSSLSKVDSIYSNNKIGFLDKQNIIFGYNGIKHTNISFSRGGNVGVDATGIRVGTLNDNYSISSSATKFQWGLRNSIADVSTPDSRRIITNTDIYSFKLPSSKKMPGVELERSDADAEELNSVTKTVSDKIKFNSNFGNTSVVASAGQVLTDKNNDSLVGFAKDNTVSVSTPIWGRGSNLGLSINNFNSVYGSTSEDRSGLGINISPIKGLNIITEQQESLIINSTNQTKIVSGQKYTLNYSPSPGTSLQSSMTESIDGYKKNETYNYRAILGGDNTLFKVDGLLKIRSNSEQSELLNTDSANASLNIKPAKNIIFTSNYLLNPDDPTKAGNYIPIEKRQYSLSHKSGSFELTGSYADTEHLKGTSAEVLAKSNGFYYYGETGFKIGWKTNSSTVFSSEYKEQFFRGTGIKSTEIFSLGLNHTRASTTFSLSSYYFANQNSPSTYRAEAKLGYKF